MRAIHFLANLPEITLVTLVTAAAVFSLGFSVLRLYRRFGRKTRYALRITYARWALGGYVVLSTVLSLLLSFGTTSGIADFGQTLPGAILVAFSSSVIIAGSSSVVGLVGRDQKHLVSITTWVYQTIDAEIERLIFSGADHGSIERAAVAGGMVTMFDAGLAAAIEGITTIEDVVRSIRTEA